MIVRFTCPSDLYLIFMVQWLKLRFSVLVCCSYTVCNRSTMFSVWKYFTMYMSVWHVLFDFDLIFYGSLVNVKFSWFSLFLIYYLQSFFFFFLNLYVFVITYSRSTYLMYGMILRCKCLSDNYHLTNGPHYHFPGLVCFLDTIYKGSTTFKVCCDCKVYMSF